MLNKASASRETIDLLLVDADQFGSDSLEVISDLRQEFGDTVGRVVMLTTARQRPDEEAARYAGVDGIYAKPVRPAKLFHVLTTALNPVNASQPHKRLFTKKERPTVTKSRARILVAEDNTVNQKVAMHMLSKLGYRCDLASNGQEAVDMLQQMPYDLVLMDCHMPEMDGYTATQLIRKREADGRQRTPILAMTANAMREDRARCLECGMDGFIPKPIALDELETVLDCWIPETVEQVEPVAAIVSFDDAPASTTSQATRTFASLDTSVLDGLRFLQDDGGGFIAGLVTTYVNDSRERIGVLRAALAQQDFAMIERAAHTIKGSSGNMGAVRMASISTALQTAGKAADLTTVMRLITELEVEFIRTRALLESSFLATNAA
jgi:CheY-like chemotaxis protein